MKRIALAAAAIAATALAGTASATHTVIDVPDDFVPTLSDTRPGGSYSVQGSGLRITTQSNTTADKVAEYVATNTPLAASGEPTLDYTAISGSIPPGFQLRVDFDNDGTLDGILVGEPAFYGNDWWLSNSAKQFVKDGAPSHTGGFGSANHGTLDQWRTAFPNAIVRAFGFSLGSGVKGDGVINAISFAGSRYTFGIELENKDECKNGGWQASTAPAFKNQGDCVSYFSSTK